MSRLFVSMVNLGIRAPREGLVESGTVTHDQFDQLGNRFIAPCRHNTRSDEGELGSIEA
jgi:hypothetical protein